jgi:hypothetical protein
MAKMTTSFPAIARRVSRLREPRTMAKRIAIGSGRHQSHTVVWQDEKRCPKQPSRVRRRYCARRHKRMVGLREAEQHSTGHSGADGIIRIRATGTLRRATVRSLPDLFKPPSSGAFFRLTTVARMRQTASGRMVGSRILEAATRSGGSW